MDIKTENRARAREKDIATRGRERFSDLKWATDILRKQRDGIHSWLTARRKGSLPRPRPTPPPRSTTLTTATKAMNRVIFHFLPLLLPLNQPAILRLPSPLTGLKPWPRSTMVLCKIILDPSFRVGILIKTRLWHQIFSSARATSGPVGVFLFELDVLLIDEWIDS